MEDEITKKQYREEKLQQENLEDHKAEMREKIDAQQQADAENEMQRKPRKKIFWYHSNEED